MNIAMVPTTIVMVLPMKVLHPVHLNHVEQESEPASGKGSSHGDDGRIEVTPCLAGYAGNS